MTDKLELEEEISIMKGALLDEIILDSRMRSVCGRQDHRTTCPARWEDGTRAEIQAGEDAQAGEETQRIRDCIAVVVGWSVGIAVMVGVIAQHGS